MVLKNQITNQQNQIQNSSRAAAVLWPAPSRRSDSQVVKAELNVGHMPLLPTVLHSKTSIASENILKKFCTKMPIHIPL